jgi:hypothetical protein
MSQSDRTSVVELSLAVLVDVSIQPSGVVGCSIWVYSLFNIIENIIGISSTWFVLKKII